MNIDNKDTSENPEIKMASPTAMLALKGLVVGLGLLIVLGVLLIGYGFYRKSSDPDWTLFSISKASPQATKTNTQLTAGAAFGNLILNDPDGCGIQSIIPENNLLYVTTCYRVFVIDSNTWKVLGSIQAQEKQ